MNREVIELESVELGKTMESTSCSISGKSRDVLGTVTSWMATRMPVSLE